MTREEAIKIIRKMLAYTDLTVRANLNANMVSACNLAIEALEREPKTGHWIYKTMEGQFCSICDEQSVWKFNYCPNCGAKMVELQESEEE